MNLVLFGFKNSGKSFLAQKLALKLSCPLIETDLEIEKLSFLQTQTWRRCPEIFQLSGENHFRFLEKTVIENLKPPVFSVIALGGGAMREDTYPLLAKLGFLVYLKAPLSLILKRQVQMPAFLNSFSDPQKALQNLFQARTAFFEQLGSFQLEAALLEDPPYLEKTLTTLQKRFQKHLHPPGTHARQ
ncbi:MAG: shikimate kinase [Parachlamydiales bacterium]|jgi:shikimate kinase